jgi:ABC-type transport system substrate-binding protein
MARVRAARSIMDEQARVAEYRDLERIIVQDEAAWIPLFSKERTYLVSDRIGNFTVGWNGWFETSYKYMSVKRPRGTEGA